MVPVGRLDLRERQVEHLDQQFLWCDQESVYCFVLSDKGWSSQKHMHRELGRAILHTTSLLVWLFS